MITMVDMDHVKTMHLPSHDYVSFQILEKNGASVSATVKNKDVTVKLGTQKIKVSLLELLKAMSETINDDNEFYLNSADDLFFAMENLIAEQKDEIRTLRGGW